MARQKFAYSLFSFNLLSIVGGLSLGKLWYVAGHPSKLFFISRVCVTCFAFRNVIKLPL